MWASLLNSGTVKPVLSGHSKIDKTKILMANGSLMQVKSFAECILQFFWPASNDNWSLNPIFVFIESGHISQVLLYFWQNIAVHEQTSAVVNFLRLMTNLVYWNYWWSKKTQVSRISNFQDSTVLANSKGSETTWIVSPFLAFAGCLLTKYRNLVSWPIKYVYFSFSYCTLPCVAK